MTTPEEAARTACNIAEHVINHFRITRNHHFLEEHERTIVAVITGACMIAAAPTPQIPLDLLKAPPNPF